MRTCGTAGHRKGAIDGMSSSGVKNIFQNDIVTHNEFFNQSKEVVDHLPIKFHHFHYKHLPREDVIKSWIIQNSSKIILDCMKQHLMVLPETILSFIKNTCAHAVHSFDSSSKNYSREMHHFILMMMMTICCLLYSSVLAQLSLFIWYRSAKKKLIVKIIQIHILKFISPGEKNLEEFYLDQEMLVERNNNFCPRK